MLWPDEGHLVIGEADGAYLWAVRIEKDGSFGPGDRYYSLRTRPNEKMHVAAMTMDAGYLLYACTPLGIQVFDPTGRLSGVILLALPFGLFLTMLHLKPDYIEKLWTHPMGIKMSLVALAMQLVGAIVIKKIVDIKV